MIIAANFRKKIILIKVKRTLLTETLLAMLS